MIKRDEGVYISGHDSKTEHEKKKNFRRKVKIQVKVYYSTFSFCEINNVFYFLKNKDKGKWRIVNMISNIEFIKI